MPKATFAVAVRFQIKPEHTDDFLAVVRTQAANSLAREPDCHQFDVCTDGDDRCRVFLYETYTDAEAFQTHRNTKHFAVFSAAVEPWVASKEVATWMITNSEFLQTGTSVRSSDSNQTNGE